MLSVNKAIRILKALFGIVHSFAIAVNSCLYNDTTLYECMKSGSGKNSRRTLTCNLSRHSI